MSLDRFPLALTLGVLLVGGALVAFASTSPRDGAAAGSGSPSATGGLVLAQNDTNDTNESNDSTSSNDTTYSNDTNESSGSNDTDTYNGSEESDTNSSEENGSTDESDPTQDDVPEEDLEPTSSGDDGGPGSSVGLTVAIVVFVVAAAGLLLWTRT